MYEILLIMNVQQSYADDLECQNERLRHQLEGLGIDPYSDAGTLTARPSDAYLESGVHGLTLISGMM